MIHCTALAAQNMQTPAREARQKDILRVFASPGTPCFSVADIPAAAPAAQNTEKAEGRRHGVFFGAPRRV